ncbi:MAG: hypothetical protein PHD15_04850 [Clostridia bacterium]|nr:hypothetical protein [Clostridia bacterium]MDD4387068.1 hypothetical protein [Clostridia bacterium]
MEYRKKFATRNMKKQVKKKVNTLKSPKLIMNILLNIAIVAMFGVFAWMVTNASSAENIDYTGQLIVTDNDVDVKLFLLKDNEYVEQLQSPSEPLIQIATLEPGSTQKYRFDVYNNVETIASITKIVFSEMYGDIDLLKDVVQITCTSPQLFTFKLEDRIEYDEVNEHYYFDFFNKLQIPANDMVSIFFNITIVKNATNAIQNTYLSINKIMFINP